MLYPRITGALRLAAAVAIIILLGVGAVFVGAGIAPAPASAVPPPLGLTQNQWIEARLHFYNVRVENAEQIADSTRLTCGLLDIDPTRGGKDRASDQLYDRGYIQPYGRGIALGTIVDVACPWHTAMLLGYR